MLEGLCEGKIEFSVDSPEFTDGIGEKVLEAEFGELPLGNSRSRRQVTLFGSEIPIDQVLLCLFRRKWNLEGVKALIHLSHRYVGADNVFGMSRNMDEFCLREQFQQSIHACRVAWGLYQEFSAS